MGFWEFLDKNFDTIVALIVFSIFVGSILTVVLVTNIYGG